MNDALWFVTRIKSFANQSRQILTIRVEFEKINIANHILLLNFFRIISDKTVPQRSATIYLSLILHFDIHPGWLQFRNISSVTQKYFDALPCFSHDIHVTLSRKCKYISFNPYVTCFNVILTNSMQKITFCQIALLCLLSWITERKVFVKHTSLIDYCKNKRKKYVKLEVVLSEKRRHTY